jgi:1-acyl-sn-glycerol-3-phosphate acyltransferase
VPVVEENRVTQPWRIPFGWLGWAASRAILALARLLYGFEVHGRENLSSSGPLIVVVDVSGRVGIVLAAFFWSVLGRFYGLGGGPLIVNIPFFRSLSRAVGVLPTFKGKSLSAVPLMRAYNLLREGEIVFVTIAAELPWDGCLQPLRPGAAWLALRAHVPIVVAAVQGDYAIWPRWSSRPHLTGKLLLKIGRPFYLCDAPHNRATESMLRAANQRLLTELEDLSDGYMLRSGATKKVET